MPETPPPPRKPITKDECRAFAVAMKSPEVAGNLAAAAKILGIDTARAYKIARKDTYIQAMQSRVDPTELVPDDADAIDRQLIVPANVDEAKAMIKQEKLLQRRDWESLGISEEQAEKMVAFERFAKLPLAHSILVTHGGLMSGYARLTNIFDRYANELEARTLPKEERKVGEQMVPRDDGDVERDWVYALVSVSAERRAVYAQLQKGRIQLLKAQQLAKEIRKNEKTGRTQQGPPLLVNVQPGATVNMGGPQP